MERIICQVPKFDRLLHNAIPKDWIGSMDKVGANQLGGFSIPQRHSASPPCGTEPTIHDDYRAALEEERMIPPTGQEGCAGPRKPN